MTRVAVDDYTEARFVFCISGKMVRQFSVNSPSKRLFSYMFDGKLPTQITVDHEHQKLYTLTSNSLFIHDFGSEYGSEQELDATIIRYSATGKLVIMKAYHDSAEFNFLEHDSIISVPIPFETFACDPSDATRIFACGIFTDTYEINLSTGATRLVANIRFKDFFVVASRLYGIVNGKIASVNVSSGAIQFHDVIIADSIDSFACCVQSNRVLFMNRGQLESVPVDFGVPTLTVETSPVTAKVSWAQDFKAESYEISLFEDNKQLQSMSIMNPMAVLLNLTPGTRYEVHVKALYGNASVQGTVAKRRFRTDPCDGNALQAVAAHVTKFDKEGNQRIFDFRNLGPSFKHIRRHIESMVPQGEIIALRFAVGKHLLEEKLRLGHVGQSIDISQFADDHIYVPFYSAGQTCELFNNDHHTALRYEETAMNVDGVRVPFGQACLIAGRTARIFRGSAVIIFDDVAQEAFPQSRAVAAGIFDAGMVKTSSLLSRNVVFVAEKSSGISQVKNSFFVKDGSSFQEVTRESVGIDSSGSFATYGVGVLRTDDVGVKTIEPVVETSSVLTQISTLSSTASNASTTALFVDASGLFWDRDDASLYFGSLKKFRIKYEAEDSENAARLVIQSLEANQYETKIEVTK